MTRITFRTALIAGTAFASLATAIVLSTTGSGPALQMVQAPVVELPRVVVTGKITPVVELPRVVVTGKVMSPEAVAARAQQVIELPRVVVTGRVTGASTLMAQAGRIAASGA